MNATSKFDDLAVRLSSAAVMAIVGLGAIWLGGVWFLALICIVVGLMGWETARLTAPEDTSGAQLLGGIAGLAVLIASQLPYGLALVVLFVPGLYGAVRFQRDKVIFFAYCTMICLAGFSLFFLRDTHGVLWMLWLALVVIATDVFGYFGGRLIGGPKFWPRVSPKKTWSGTIAGWIAAAVVGLLFAAFNNAGFGLVIVSVLMSFASQMGDIAESAIKRRAGVKDSSALIPGHGGLLDRFDGMLGASVTLLLLQLVIDSPVPAL